MNGQSFWNLKHLVAFNNFNLSCFYCCWGIQYILIFHESLSNLLNDTIAFNQMASGGFPETYYLVRVCSRSIYELVPCLPYTEVLLFGANEVEKQPAH